MTSPARPTLKDVFHLEYPQSVGVFATYEEAQKVVDYLADQQFLVENLCIVGTDLRSVERVLGRRTWGTVIRAGAQQGVSMGLMIGVLMLLFTPTQNVWAIMLAALLIAIVIGIVIQAIGYAASRGKRDFTSVTQTVATRYEVLSEHKVAAKAREVIAGMPGARAAAFAPQGGPVTFQPGPNAYPSAFGQVPYGAPAQAPYGPPSQAPYYPPGYPPYPYPYPVDPGSTPPEQKPSDGASF